MSKELKKSFWDILFISAVSLLALPLMMVSEALQGRFMTLGGFEEYANFAIFLTILALLNTLTSGWLVTGYNRLAKSAYAEKKNIAEYNFAYILMTVVQLVLLYLLITLFQENVFSLLSGLNHFIIIIAVALNLIKLYFYNVLKVITRLKQQALIDKVVSKIFYPISIFITFFSLGKLNFEIMVYLYLLTELLIILVSVLSSPFKYSFSFSINIKVIKEFVSYSLPFIISSLSVIIIQNIDLLIIKKYLDDESVSYYNSAYKMFTMGRNLILPIIQSVFLPILIVFYEKKYFNKINYLFFQRISNQLAIGIILVTLIVHFVSPFIFEIIYDGKFNSAVRLFRSLLVSFIFITLSIPISLLMDVYKIVKERVLGVVLMGVINIVLDYYFVQSLGVIGPTYATGIAFAFGVFYSMFILNKREGLFNKQLIILPSMYAAFFVLSEINQTHIYQATLLISFILFFILYSKKMRFFKEDDLEMFKNISIPKIGQKLLKKIYT